MGEKTLQQFLNTVAIKKLADKLSFERGEHYFLNGVVEDVSENNGTINGVVQGTYQYKIKIWASDELLGYDCDCPVGREGVFCKHCVAVALQWLKGEGNVEKTKLKTSENDIRAYLMQLCTKELVDIVIERMQDNKLFREKLIFKANNSDVNNFPANVFKKLIDRATYVAGFVHYREMWDYTNNIDLVVNDLREVIDKGQAGAAIKVAEYFIDQVEEASNNVDDSNGEMGGILSELQELHHTACARVKPDPEELAKRLFHKELNAEYDAFYDAAAIYADVLGEKGIAVYRQFAEEAWKEISELKPGDQNDWASKRFHLTRIMECLAEMDNDIEKLVAVKARNLTSAYTFLNIAEIYQKAGKADNALEWAEKGVEAFPEHTDSRLRAFLAVEYHKRDRHNEAIGLMWKEFFENPRIEHYKSLCEHAGKNKTWDKWRENAIQFIENAIRNRKETVQCGSWLSYSDLLIRIYMWEKDFEKAWSLANEKNCYKTTWLELAKHRAQRAPLEAAKAYQAYVYPTVEQGSNNAYEEAVEYLKLIKNWMCAAGEHNAFSQYLLQTCVIYRRKRNFVKFVNRAKL